MCAHIRYNKLLVSQNWGRLEQWNFVINYTLFFLKLKEFKLLYLLLYVSMTIMFSIHFPLLAFFMNVALKLWQLGKSMSSILFSGKSFNNYSYRIDCQVQHLKMTTILLVPGFNIIKWQTLTLWNTQRFWG